MDRIERYLKNKYYETGFDKFLKFTTSYQKIKWKIEALPYYISSTLLCYRYPFLRFDVNKRGFQKGCYYWSLPNGWRKAFGIQMCEELRKALKNNNFLNKYQITDLKEKFGELVIYDAGAPEEIHDILMKYEYISARTCIVCGRRAKYVTKRFISPYCENCIDKEKLLNKPYTYHEDIDWYGWKKK